MAGLLAVRGLYGLGLMSAAVTGSAAQLALLALVVVVLLARRQVRLQQSRPVGGARFAVARHRPVGGRR
jgi:hypothetical protein